MVSSKTIAEVSNASGVSYITAAELLGNGWTFVQEENQPSKWVSPSARISRRDKDAKE